MAHVFDGKLYFTRDHMQANFIPKNLKLPQPKSAPKTQAKASSKAFSSGEHVQLFRMAYDCKKGFQAAFVMLHCLCEHGCEHEFPCFKHFLVFACLWEHGWRLRCTHTMRSLACVSVVACVVCKLRPCPSYSGRRDRINLGLWRSLYKGGWGGGGYE